MTVISYHMHINPAKLLLVGGNRSKECPRMHSVRFCSYPLQSGKVIQLVGSPLSTTAESLYINYNYVHKHNYDIWTLIVCTLKIHTILLASQFCMSDSPARRTNVRPFKPRRWRQTDTDRAIRIQHELTSNSAIIYKLYTWNTNIQTH